MKHQTRTPCGHCTPYGRTRTLHGRCSRSDCRRSVKVLRLCRTQATRTLRHATEVAGCMPVHDVKPAGQRDTAGRELGVSGVTGDAAATAESAVVP